MDKILGNGTVNFGVSVAIADGNPDTTSILAVAGREPLGNTLMIFNRCTQLWFCQELRSYTHYKRMVLSKHVIAL